MGDDPREEFRPLWYRLPHGSKKPLARHLCVQVSMLRGLAHGTYVPASEDIRRRLSRFLMELARDEIEVAELSPSASAKQLWRANRPSHVWRRKANRA